MAKGKKGGLLQRKPMKALVHLDKMVLAVVRQGGLTAKTLKGKLISKFKQPRGQLNRQLDSPTGRENLLFFR